jgi:hypothetical protein
MLLKLGLFIFFTVFVTEIFYFIFIMQLSEFVGYGPFMLESSYVFDISLASFHFYKLSVVAHARCFRPSQQKRPG